MSEPQTIAVESQKRVQIVAGPRNPKRGRRHYGCAIFFFTRSSKRRTFTTTR